MKKRKPLLFIITASVVLLAVFTYANPWQDHNQDDHQGHHQDHSSRPMELHSVMRLLMLDVHTINEGIFTQNFDLIESGAASIVDHPQLSDKTLTLLEETLGNQLAAFEEYDHRSHIYADSIRQAAQDSNMDRVLDHYRMMKQSCVACHSVFQDRLRRARLNSTVSE